MVGREKLELVVEVVVEVMVVVAVVEGIAQDLVVLVNYLPSSLAEA